MAAITVKAAGADTYEVTVEDRTTTTHTVTLDNGYYEKLTGGAMSPEALIEKSFTFLLQRESNTMILSRFHLKVISQYFPEFEREIGQ